MVKSVKTIIDQAKLYCENHKLRLTAPRLAVLDILAQSDKPLGAYDVLKELGKTINSPKPPTAYRAIDFWRDHGFVHKIESLNAFVLCDHHHEEHKDTHFLICDECHHVDEIHSHHNISESLNKSFKPSHSLIETHGICETCTDN